MAGAVGVAGGGNTGVAVSVAGSISLNAIQSEIRASIEGSTSTIDASAITYTLGSIVSDSVVVAGAIAAAFGKQTGVSVAVGVAYASNEVASKSMRLFVMSIMLLPAVPSLSIQLCLVILMADYTSTDGTRACLKGIELRLR